MPGRPNTAKRTPRGCGRVGGSAQSTEAPTTGKKSDHKRGTGLALWARPVSARGGGEGGGGRGLPPVWHPPPPPKARSAAAECHGQLTPDPGPKHGEREGAARQPLPIP